VLVHCQGAIGRTSPSGRKINTDEDFAVYLLEDAHVAVIQGSAYGLSPYFRISFATSQRAIEAAIEAVAKAMRALN
jgi:aspartate aminotransferase